MALEGPGAVESDETLLLEPPVKLPLKASFVAPPAMSNDPVLRTVAVPAAMRIPYALAELPLLLTSRIVTLWMKCVPRLEMLIPRGEALDRARLGSVGIRAPSIMYCHQFDDSYVVRFPVFRAADGRPNARRVSR